MSALADLWNSQLAERAGAGREQPAWLHVLRQAGAAAFEKHGLPHRKVEDWKYTSLKLLEARSQKLAELGHSQVAVDEWPDPLVAEAFPIVTLGNGRVQGALPATRKFETLPLEEALAAESHASWVRPLLESLEVQSTARAFAALNNSMLGPGLVIHVPGGQDAGPLLLQWAFGAEPPAMLHSSRVLIRLGANASLDLVEQFQSAAAHAQGLNLVIQVQLEPGARLRHVRVQQESEEAALITRIECDTGRGASYALAAFDLGGGLVRHDTQVTLAQPGAEADVNGAFVIGGSGHIDNHVVIDHAAGPSRSGQFFRGVLGGRSRGVWNGKARIRPGADGSSVRQSNGNLLMSPLAEIDTKPELEIYADEVEASHGATVGQLDEEAVFYLRSRGLDGDEARAMLTGAFCRTVLERTPGLTGALGESIAGRLEFALQPMAEAAPTSRGSGPATAPRGDAE